MQALVLSLIPLGTAFAQSYPFVRVTRDGTDISTWRVKREVRMRAPKGTVLEVMYVEGDRYNHRDSNWYWVLLPADSWGSRLAGWIRGDAVEPAPRPEPAPVPAAAKASLTEVPQSLHARREPSDVAIPSRAPVGEAPAARPVIPDVILTFQFGKSELTDEAEGQLARAFEMPNASVRGISVALEGHADWTGPEAYNERLGLARAETVRRYLTDQLRIPGERIRVVSYGENNPVAPNTTREGRARNRRVVVKGGA
jgi:outer membrane protein OmpA-like peptidoglycan-associated protein